MSSAYLVNLTLFKEQTLNSFSSKATNTMFDKVGLVGAPCGNLLFLQHNLAKSSATCLLYPKEEKKLIILTLVIEPKKFFISIVKTLF